MHIKFHEDFSHLNEIDLRAHDALIDRLLHLHLEKNHLICLSPANIISFRKAIQFGPQAQRVLDTILKKSQDYLGNLRACPLHIAILPLGSKTPTGKVGSQINIKSEDLPLWISKRPEMYIENAITDGPIYSFIIKNTMSFIGGSSSNICLVPRHGGGSTLGALLENVEGERTQGICICDRDTASIVPPFIRGTTGQTTLDALCRIGLAIPDQIGQSSTNPFFSFLATEGWGVENYIGPNLLHLFFENNRESRANQTHFIRVFPNFPNLTPQEMQSWWMINLKTDAQPHDIIQNACASRYNDLSRDENYCRSLSNLSIPDSAIRWIGANSKSGRFYRNLIDGFLRDMKNESYKSAAIEITTHAMTACAADDRMNFA